MGRVGWPSVMGGPAGGGVGEFGWDVLCCWATRACVSVCMSAYMCECVYECVYV